MGLPVAGAPGGAKNQGIGWDDAARRTARPGEAAAFRSAAGEARSPPPARHRSSRISLARVYTWRREDGVILILASCIFNADRNCTATP